MLEQLRELLEKRKRLLDESRAILEKADAEKRDADGLEMARYEEIQNELDKLDDAIEKRENQIERERKAADRSFELFEAQKENNKVEFKKQGKDSEEYRAAFRSYLTKGKDALNKEELRALSAGTSGAGQELVVGEQLFNEILQEIDKKTILFSEGRKLYVPNAMSLGVPQIDTDMEDLTWSTEIQAFDEDTALAFSKRALTPHLMKKLIKVSDKLMRTSPFNVEGIVKERAGYKVGRTAEAAAMTGDGSGKALGIYVASNDGIPTSRDVTAAAVNAFTADELIDVTEMLDQEYYPGAKWMVHKDFVKRARKLKDSNGQYLLQPGLAQGDPQLLLDFPIARTDLAPNTFTAAKYIAVLGNPAFYWWVVAMDMRIEREDHLYKATSQIGYFIDVDLDGQPVQPKAFARLITAAS